MTTRAKKRLGRPPGRKAPHRPVLSQRVPQELYDVIKTAAGKAGRTMGEEMVWRVERSFEWEKTLGDASALDPSVLEELLARAAAKGVQLALGNVTLRGEGALHADAQVIRANKGEQP
jgi:hypothetical protein